MRTKIVFKNIFFDATTENFIVRFSYNAGLVAELKDQINYKFRSYDPPKKQWTVSKEKAADLLEYAKRNDFVVQDSAKRIFKEIEDAHKELQQEIELPDLNINIPLKMQLFPYQAKGVAFNLKNNATLIGDVQGLGKTCQAIATVVAWNAFPCLVISPAHLKINWKDEWEMWTNKRAALLKSPIAKKPGQWFKTGYLQVAIVNYESLPKYFAKDMMRSSHTNKVTKVELNGLEEYFKSVIVDESHYCNNEGTQRFKITREILKGKEKKLLLSGTPVNNKVTDLIPQLKLLGRIHEFGGDMAFRSAYGEGMGRNTLELQMKLKKSIYYRREKHEVATELPDKFRQAIKVSITTKKEYDDAEEDLENYLREYKKKSETEIERSMRGEVMVRINALKQISARGKIKEVKEFVDDTISQGEKIVLFAHHKEIYEPLIEYYGTKCVRIVGGMTPEQKDKSVKAFQANPDILVMIVSIQSGKTGLTLTAASKVGMIELPWTSTDCDQCEDRLHRHGQFNNVNCYYFIGEDTIDYDIYRLIEKKRAMFKSVTGANERVEVSIFDDLLTGFLKKS